METFRLSQSVIFLFSFLGADGIKEMLSASKQEAASESSRVDPLHPLPRLLLGFLSANAAVLLAPKSLLSACGFLRNTLVYQGPLSIG